MIEFQLTVYMCSYCTRVHNVAQDCVRHEMEEHSATRPKPLSVPPTPKTSTTATTLENIEQIVASTAPSADSTFQPFTITDNDVKPDMNSSEIGDHHDALFQHDDQVPAEMTMMKNPLENIYGSATMMNLNVTTEERYPGQPSTSRSDIGLPPRKHHSTVCHSWTKVPCRICGKVGC